jgi:hypothetical protein
MMNRWTCSGNIRFSMDLSMLGLLRIWLQAISVFTLERCLFLRHPKHRKGKVDLSISIKFKFSHHKGDVYMTRLIEY